VAANPFALAHRLSHSGPISDPRPRASYFAGAAVNRLNGDWLMAALSADQAIRMDGPTLRDRAQDLVANNSTAARIPTLFSENVIGKDGIILQPRVTSSRTDEGRPIYNKQINAAIDRAWWDWYEARHASVDGQSSWCDIETLVTESEPVDGEVFLRLVDGFPNRHGFAVDVLDPAQVDWNYNVEAGDGRNAIKMGVEVDRWGRPLRYHIWGNHPSESRRGERVAVDADDIIHLYLRRRPKQTRAVTWFSPVVIDLKMLGGYREAELIAARTSAAKMGFLQQIPGADPTRGLDPEVGETFVRMDADPGVIEQLPDGLEFKGWDPAHPTTAFKDFNSAILMSVATALRVSYMSLSGDLNGTTYGSGRIGLKAEQLVYQKLQQRLIEKVHTRVYRRWIRMAQLTGALSLGSFDTTRFHAVAWHPRAMPWIDPKAEVETAEIEQRLGMTNLTRLSAEKGHDLEEDLQTYQRERELFTQYGKPHPDEVVEAEIEAAKNPAPVGAGSTTSRPLKRAAGA
jgi:lambda family phage portal protein